MYRIKQCTRAGNGFLVLCDRVMSRTSPSAFSVVQQRNVSTVKDQEVAHFRKLASSWWQEGGSMSSLKSMNQLRVPFAVEVLASDQSSGTCVYEPLRGKRILDVGCGGGFLCEALATLGAEVVGVDACSNSISVASEHARATLAESVRSRLTYIVSSVEQLEEATKSETAAKLRTELSKTDLRKAQFDLVVASEIIEHVANAPEFVRACASLAKTGGSLLLTTINRTLTSLALAKGAAEYVFELLPRDTHSWDRFVTPSELERLLDRAACDVRTVRGMQYDLFARRWTWASHTLMNYAVHAVKRAPLVPTV